MASFNSRFEMNGSTGKISMKSGQEIEWSIGNFCSVRDQCCQSPYFTISGSKWCLLLYPHGDNVKVGDWIPLYLKQGQQYLAYESSPISVRCLFGVKKVDGTVERMQRRKITWVFEKGDAGFGCQFLKRSELLRRQSELLASGTLTLTCTLWTGTHFEHTGNLDTLSRNLADLLISKKGSDATLLVLGKEFPVHKLILSARSPVLAATFEADMKGKRTGLVEFEDFEAVMKDKRTGLVEIEDCDPETFEDFLTFLYSGKVENASCDVFELYRIADKYDVQDLMSECVIWIMTNLSVENVLEAAILGYRFNEPSLWLKIDNFFKQNYAEIISSTEWDDLILSENATVANQLLKAMAKK